MHGNRAIQLGAALALFLLAGTAAAGPLPSDPNAMAGWHGTSLLFTGSNGGTTLNAFVEYAVYAPGMVETSGPAYLNNPGFAMDPSHGTDYVYAYEILNQASTTAGEWVKDLTIHLIPPAVPTGSTRVGNDAGTPELGISPNLSRFSPSSGSPPTSAVWNYTTTLTLVPGQHSDILFFTSAYPPIMRNSQLDGGNNVVAAPQDLPTPTPEPGTAALAAIAAICLLAATHVRRRSRSR